MIIREKPLNDFSEEFSVFCYNCRTELVVEGPQDLEKEYTRFGVLLYIKCPKCGHNLIVKTKYEDFQKYKITVDFLNKIRTRKIVFPK